MIQRRKAVWRGLLGALGLFSCAMLVTPGANAEGWTANYSTNDQVLKLARDKKARGKLQQAAQAGDAKAAYDLGTLYLWGAGVKQDFKTSERWFRKSAESGYRPAQLYLAAGYGNGYGVAGALPRDQVEGLRWMLVAQAAVVSRKVV